MPGNLEAPPIVPEHTYVVKKKSRRNPYPTTFSARPAPGWARCHEAGVKGAEANP